MRTRLPRFPLFCARQHLLFYGFLVAANFLACNSGTRSPEGTEARPAPAPVAAPPAPFPVSGGRKVAVLGRNIRSMLHDRHNHYWFGTNDEGFYRFDGKTLLQFTDRDGLANNQVQTIQEDPAGSLWFGTGNFQVSRFDGRTFTTFPNAESARQSAASAYWQLAPDDRWFYAEAGAYRWDGNSFASLPFPAPEGENLAQPQPRRLGEYSVYCHLKDRKGQLWFGTQSRGVCRYDGKNFTWLTEKGLAGPAVRALYEDRAGNLWFGNNGSGLFRYDGYTLTNVTEEKGLGNPEFLKTGEVAAALNPGTLARVWSINEDRSGMLWIATIDAGLWCYDGKVLRNFTTAEGLPANAVNLIYKDRKGELWFGTEGAGVCRFNGQTFSSFSLK
jgi:ligand-binding sensor domain-containing protein